MNKVYQARILDFFSVFLQIKNEFYDVTFVLIYCYNHLHYVKYSTNDS